MPEHPPEHTTQPRRSGKEYQKAIKPMDRSSVVATKVVSFVLFALIVGVFIRSHFMGPPHGGDHELMQTVLEYGPLAMFSGLSISLFVWPEATVRLFLMGLHKAIEIVPVLIAQLRIFRGKNQEEEKHNTPGR